ncbi:hypothetical protein CVT24_005227 [Panaeolus cyanescens]|uniref:HNH nuclease domain-containing protein n=1 Tax=Panaeolus cyanescens TaxID=181874 RepID=A0A409Y9J5_9AGAR|nr:hypothetical protein CVT24_005227 [Panaeolus cyanescens]
MASILADISASAVKRAQNADPNMQRCLIENCSTSMAVQLAHVYDREEAAMKSLEWSWGLIHGCLNLDTRRNIFFVGASLYEMYKRRRWSLVPEEQVVRQFFYEGGRRPRKRRDFPNLQSQTFKYKFLPIRNMEDICITRQSEDKSVTIHEYPFPDFPTITSHIHPSFVLLHLASALSCIDRNQHDTLVKQYPWLNKIIELHTSWFARLPDNADQNLTFWPSHQAQSSSTSQPTSDDDISRTPPHRIPVLTTQPSNQQIVQGLDVERPNTSPSSMRAAPRIPQAYPSCGQKRELCEVIQDLRPNKRRRLLTSTDLKRHHEDYQRSNALKMQILIDNLQRCLIENCSTSKAVQLGHFYDREEAARDHRMESLEWIWGLVQGSLNLDTRRNIFFVGASLYEMYKRRNWSLVPEENVVRQFFYDGGTRPRTRRDFPKFQSLTFKYTSLAIKDMEDVYISRQSEDNTVAIYEHPFSGFPP